MGNENGIRSTGRANLSDQDIPEDSTTDLSSMLFQRTCTQQFKHHTSGQHHHFCSAHHRHSVIKSSSPAASVYLIQIRFSARLTDGIDSTFVATSGVVEFELAHRQKATVCLTARWEVPSSL